MILGLIGNLILGAIVGYAGRLALPGAQNLSVVQTVGVGVIAALVGFFIFLVVLAADHVRIDRDSGRRRHQDRHGQGLPQRASLS